MKNKLKLYGTLGPSCCHADILFSMLQAGMTGVRLNLSHRKLSDCSGWLQELEAASSRYHLIPDLLVDLQGPELRIGTLASELDLYEGMLVRLVPTPNEAAQPADSDKELSEKDEIPTIPVPPLLFSSLDKRMMVKLNDGRILLELLDAGSYGMKLAKVVRGGPLSSRKSIACDQVSLSLPALTQQDRETLRDLRKFHVTGVMQPFVRDKNSLMALKEELHREGMDHIRIYAKIETMEAAEHLPDLLPFCDEVVIARGDLGNAVPLPTLPAWQKRIASCCLHFKKPFMVVTQMLASMEHNPVPTRAELTDIFQAVLDGASSLMLTGETAVGSYPLESIRYLSETAWEAKRYVMESRFHI